LVKRISDALPEAQNLVDKGLMTGTVIQDAKSFAQGLYTIGSNLINSSNPIENTNYKFSDGEIIIPVRFQEYISKANLP
jgi:methyl-galactoside transport system substrate-binding protein